MLYSRSNSLENVLFWLSMIPLCLSIWNFLFLNFALIGYIEERNNEKIYLNTRCFINGTITLNNDTPHRKCELCLKQHLYENIFVLNCNCKICYDCFANEVHRQQATTNEILS